MTTNEKFIQLQITFPNAEEAETVAAFLVDEKWAACAQIVGKISSVYRWRGAVESATETLLLAKTRAALFERVAAEIKRRHSYETPQIVAVPLDFIASDYADWLDAEIRRD